jgi:hypothetical protein
MSASIPFQSKLRKIAPLQGQTHAKRIQVDRSNSLKSLRTYTSPLPVPRWQLLDSALLGHFDVQCKVYYKEVSHQPKG